MVLRPSEWGGGGVVSFISADTKTNGFASVGRGRGGGVVSFISADTKPMVLRPLEGGGGGVVNFISADRFCVRWNGLGGGGSSVSYLRTQNQ